MSAGQVYRGAAVYRLGRRISVRNGTVKSRRPQNYLYDREMADNPLDEIRARLNEAMADVHRARGKRLTGVELAAMVGVAQQTVSDWLNGKNKPFLENMLPLAQALGVRAGWLAFGELPQYPDDLKPVRSGPPMRPDPDEADGIGGRPCVR